MVAANGLKRIYGLMFAAPLVMVAIALSLVFVHFQSQNLEFAAKGLSPIFGVSASARNLPMMAEGIRDPDLLKHKPEAEADAIALMEEIKIFESDLGRAQGARRADLHGNAYKGYVSLSYYLEDVVSGRTVEEVDKNKARSNLVKVRSAAMRHARSMTRYSKNKRDQATALYHASAIQYLSGTRTASVRTLVKIQKQGLSGKLVRRAQLIIDLHNLHYGNKANKATAASKLRRLVRGLPADGSMVARLALARYYAGLNRNGARSTKAVSTYRTYLSQATRRVAGLSSAQKSEVLAYSVGVWQSAEGRSINWAKAPIQLSRFGESDTVKGIVERGALANWKSGNSRGAISKYLGLARSTTGSIKRGAIDLRILDLHRITYSKSKNTTAYERALTAAQTSYLDTGILGDGNESKAQAMLVEVQRRYRTLAMGELDRVQRKGVSRAERRRAIALGKNYMAALDGDAKIEEVKAKIASIYLIDKQYAIAVAMYRDLAETNVSGKAVYYYKRAVAAQSVLAKWSTDLVWYGQKNGSSQAREELLTMYQAMQKSQGKKHDWYAVAQIGLLNMNLGHQEEAFKIWNASLAIAPRHPNATKTSGIMLRTYETGRSWSKLEDLARLVRKQKIAPNYKGKRLDTTRILALALLEGGKQAVAEQRYDVGVKKLEEFVKKFKRAANYDEGYFTLATAYRGNRQHKQAITTLIAFASNFKSSKYYKSALVNGGDWSVPMAYEENALYFYGKFMERYPQDQDAARISKELVDLYLGREIYSSAIKILVSTNTPSTLSQALNLEDRHGSESRATALADMILKRKNVPEEAKAEALAVKVRFAARSNNIPALKSLSSQISRLGGNTYESQEALGEVRYLLAKADSKTVIKEYYNLALKDPKALLNRRYAAYNNVKNQFMAVCDAGGTSYCARAMNDLSNVSVDFLASLEDLEVQKTLSKEVVGSFSQRKQAILNTLAGISQKADSRALGTIAEGNTDPNTTQAVLWSNSSDWNFDRVTGETGNGYVQWSASQAE